MANLPSPALRRWCVVLVAVFLVGAGVAVLWRVPKPAAKLAATPDESVVVRSRALQNGQACRVVVHAPGIASHPVEQLQRIEMQVNGQAIFIPPAAFQDLRQISCERIQIADFAGDAFLLLGGDLNGKPWSVKFTEHDGRITKREFSRLGERPVITRFAAPIRPKVIALRQEDLEVKDQHPSTTPLPISSTP